MNKSSADVEARRPVTGSVLFRLLDTAHELEGRLEGRLSKIGLSGAKLGVLMTLARAGEPLALSELAKHKQCVRSNMTQLVDRLEADGLVRRVGDSSDRRVVRAALTTAGKKLHEQGAAILEDVEREVAEALGGADGEAMGRAFSRLKK